MNITGLKLSGLITLLMLSPHGASSQAKAGGEGLKFYIGNDSSSYLKATAAVQVWTRYTENNPGSVITPGAGAAGYAAPETFDIGIRRARFQLFGPLNKRTFFYSQFGINNFSSLSPRKQGAFFHDLTAEYVLIPGLLNTGGGLTGWTGLARYASPAIASTLLYDAPLFEQTTNDVNDQFLRKLSLFAKGKIKKLDYRLALGKPFVLHTATPLPDTLPAGKLLNLSVFSPLPPRLQAQGYLNWQFLDQESNLTPYTNGAYLGKKRVFNIGAGWIYQPEAMRHSDMTGKTVYTAMRLLSADIFLDYALDMEKQNAVTIYGGFFDFDFGPNYVRPLGVMNTVNGSSNPSVNRLSGAGNAFPMFGTGQVMYLQAGYLFRKNLLHDFGTLQPVADIMVANYEGLNSYMTVWNAGLNWLISGHNSRISLNYQSRPVFNTDPVNFRGSELSEGRRGMLVLLLQAFI